MLSGRRQRREQNEGTVRTSVLRLSLANGGRIPRTRTSHTNVPYDEVVRDGEAAVFGRERLLGRIQPLVEECAHFHGRRRRRRLDHGDHGRQCRSRVDNVLNDDQVAVLDVLHLALAKHHRTGGARAFVRAGPDEFHVVPLPQILEGVTQVRVERARPLERAQQDRAAPAVVLVNQVSELPHPCPDLVRLQHQARQVSLVLGRVHVLVGSCERERKIRGVMLKVNGGENRSSRQVQPPPWSSQLTVSSHGRYAVVFTLATDAGTALFFLPCP
jgi:hypothetical protein